MTAIEQGIFIKTVRIAKGFTVKELAELVRVRAGAIYNIECGFSYGTIETLEMIERVLEIKKGTLRNPKPRHSNGMYDPTGLKALRRACKLNQSEVAEVFGVTRNVVNCIEQGQGEFAKHLLPQIRDFLCRLATLKCDKKENSHRDK